MPSPAIPSEAGVHALHELLRAGTLAEIRIAVDAGTDVVGFVDEHGCDAMQPAVFGGGATRDEEMTGIVRLLAGRPVVPGYDVGYQEWNNPK